MEKIEMANGYIKLKPTAKDGKIAQKGIGKTYSECVVRKEDVNNFYEVNGNDLQ